MQQITVQELYKNWAFYNPHYNFWYENQEIKSIHATADYKYYAAYTYDDKRILVLNDDLIEAVPKAAHSTELQDSSDLDATLPIDPRETAQRDHDEIQRLRAENAKMREFIESLTNPAIGGYYGENLIKFAKLFIERLDQ